MPPEVPQQLNLNLPESLPEPLVRSDSGTPFEDHTTHQTANQTGVPTDQPTDRGNGAGHGTGTIRPESLTRGRWTPRSIGIALVGLLLLGGGGFLGIQTLAAKPDQAASGGKGSRKDAVTAVRVATAERKTVPVQLQAIGTVQPSATVAVTPQAAGKITGVFFKKGDEISKGQLLFTIDDRPQTAALQQARGTLAKSQALISQAKATKAKDEGQIEQARATLAKSQALINQAKATKAKDEGLVRQAQATLAKDIAQAEYAKSQSKRYQDLAAKGAISQDQADQYRANEQALAATVQADREAIENAKAVVQGDIAAIANAEAVAQGDAIAIDNAKAVVQGDQATVESAEAGFSGDGGTLANAEVQASYTKIYAPADGRAGNVLVTEGNVVQASGSNPLVTIAQIRPVQVSFAIPEASLATVQQRADRGKLPVEVTFEGNEKPISGSLSFINNTVDNTTGTIQLIGDFDNANGKLFPGQFVNTTLTLKQQANAIVVPSQAVQTGPNGQFVFVVNEDGSSVDNIPVTATSTVGGLSVVQKGLLPGDQVVIDGQANLVSGGKIKIKADGGADAGGDAGTGSGKKSRKSKSGGGSPGSGSAESPAPGAAKDSASGGSKESGGGAAKGSDAPPNPTDNPAAAPSVSPSDNPTANSGDPTAQPKKRRSKTGAPGEASGSPSSAPKEGNS
jgi:membrane fusion protein, multidrug efflux system